MKYRKLGNSELLISEIGFGSWLTFTDPQRKQLVPSTSPAPARFPVADTKPPAPLEPEAEKEG